MAPPSLHGVPRDGSPASAILWDAPTPRRPSRPVRFLHEPIPSCRPWFAPLGRGRPTGGQGVVGSGLPIRIDDGNVGVSQVPWKPWWSLSVLFDPGRIRQAEWTMSELPDTAPACVHDEGSRRLVLSGLNHTTFDLTVYASQDRPPHHHARLASGCWSSFTRRDSYPQGFSERFQSSSLFLLVCLFPASLAYWRQRREECCNPPEALTSWERLLPPARCKALVHHAAWTAYHKDHLARDPPGETHAYLVDACRLGRSPSFHSGGLPCLPSRPSTESVSGLTPHDTVIVSPFSDPIASLPQSP